MNFQPRRGVKCITVGGAKRNLRIQDTGYRIQTTEQPATTQPRRGDTLLTVGFSLRHLPTCLARPLPRPLPTREGCDIQAIIPPLLWRGGRGRGLAGQERRCRRRKATVNKVSPPAGLSSGRLFCILYPNILYPISVGYASLHLRLCTTRPLRG
jgi:hypothetical protein